MIYKNKILRANLIGAIFKFIVLNLIFNIPCEEMGCMILILLMIVSCVIFLVYFLIIFIYSNIHKYSCSFGWSLFPIMIFAFIPASIYSTSKSTYVLIGVSGFMLIALTQLFKNRYSSYLVGFAVNLILFSVIYFAVYQFDLLPLRFY